MLSKSMYFKNAANKILLGKKKSAGGYKLEMHRDWNDI